MHSHERNDSKRGIRLGMDRIRRVFGPEVSAEVRDPETEHEEVVIWIPTGSRRDLVGVSVHADVEPEITDATREALHHQAETMVIHALLRPE